MRFFILTMTFLVGSSISHGEVQDFNQAIAEASFNQKRLHRQLLRILQGFEVSIAENDFQAPPQNSPAIPDYGIRLRRVSDKTKNL